MKAVLTGLVKFYRALPRLRPPSCRFDPTCSQYALTALERHGAFKGSYYFFRRLARCHPWGGFGYDPVPDRKPAQTNPTAASPVPASPVPASPVPASPVPASPVPASKAA